MFCPICETDNPEDAAECANCGKQLFSDADLLDDIEPIVGLELTLQPPVDVVAEQVAGLEHTQLIEKDLQIQSETMPGVEHTQVEADPDAPVNWTGGNTPIEGTRLQEDPAAPVNWTVSSMPIEMGGGARPLKPEVIRAAARRTDEVVLCPGCFARVPAGPRCDECGTPFPVREL